MKKERGMGVTIVESDGCCYHGVWFVGDLDYCTRRNNHLKIWASSDATEMWEGGATMSSGINVINGMWWKEHCRELWHCKSYC